MVHRIALSLALTLFASSGLAEEVPSGLISAGLRDGWRTGEGSQMAALELRLAPGWKTYWRTPGEAGIPPEFDWSGSANLAGVTYHWPKPEVIDLNGLRSFGYHGTLVLPIEFHPARRGQPVSVAARIDIGVCNDICVPVTLDLKAELGTGATPDPVIRAALAEAPEAGAAAGLGSALCEAEPIRDGLRLTSRLKLPSVGPDEIAVVELADRSIWVSPADTRRVGGELSTTADLVPSDAAPFALDRSTVRITVFGGDGRVVEVQGCSG